MIGNPDVQPPIICQACGADSMGCQVKRGLGGRLCCDQCDHDLVRRDGEDHDHDDDDVVRRHVGGGVDHDDGDGVDHHDQDHVDHHDRHEDDR